MGWSDYTVRAEINQRFKRLKKKYRFSWVSAPYPQVRLQFEGTLRISEAKDIVSLFPDDVYVQFESGVSFEEADPGNTFEVGGI